MNLVNAPTTAVAQEYPNRRTAMLGAAALPLAGGMLTHDPADGALMAACAKLQALCGTPLPATEAAADDAVMARYELFEEEIRTRTAMTAAGGRAQVLAWLSLYGHSTDGAEALAEMFEGSDRA